MVLKEVNIINLLLFEYISLILKSIIYYKYYIKNIINKIINTCLCDSFKNFVDFQNPFCDCHSKLDLCDIFVLKRLVWS